MKNVIIVGCGAYMDSGYGCPGEWRCMKAAGLGEGIPADLFGLAVSVRRVNRNVELLAQLL